MHTYTVPGSYAVTLTVTYVTAAGREAVDVTSQSDCVVVSRNSSGLVAWYPFDGDLRDYSGNGNDGTPTGATSFVPAMMGQALKLGGINNVGFVCIPDDPLLASPDEVTYACIFRVDSTVGQNPYDCSGTPVEDAPQCLFAKRGDRNGFYLNVMLETGGRLAVQFGVAPTTTGVSFYVGLGGRYEVGTWIHLALVYSYHDVILYIDGFEPIRSSWPLVSFSLSNSNDLYVGVQQNKGSEACSGFLPDWWYPLNGAIDDLRIYNRALSPSEVAALGDSL
jgi:hypothetical protein